MISVMTLNIGNGLTPDDRLVSWLRSSGAGIVGLQEVAEDQASEVARELAEIYPYQVLHGTGFSGRGLLSRYPIVSHEMLELRRDRSDLRVVLTISDQEATVIVAHPLPPKLQVNGIAADPETETHVEGLLDLTLESAPAILLGDFNMTPRNPLYSRMEEAGLVDAYRASGSGSGLTFPVRPGKMRRVNHRMHWLPLIPVSRIDYIWHTPEFRTVDAWVGENIGSDHLPVMARLIYDRDWQNVADGPEESAIVTP